MSEVLSLPISPAMLGRLAARRGRRFDECPYPPDDASAWEWRQAYGEARGIPKTAEGRVQYLLGELERLSVVLRFIRADERVPEDVRRCVHVALVNDPKPPQEMREG